ncbi:MAG: hypothetical protein H7X75_09530 [Burkholderiaceae bacterium]|nr:hypothetical protein [Burkholderiaceae bacterium]
MNERAPKIQPVTVFVSVFWTAAFAFIALDWSRATPHDRFDEPPPWQLGQDKIEGTGHCAAPLTADAANKRAR